MIDNKIGNSIFRFEQKAGIDSKLGNWSRLNRNISNEKDEEVPKNENFSLNSFTFYYSHEGKFLGKVDNNGYNQVKLAFKKTNKLKNI